ncbi:uncharacterized protein N7458_005440 [Penicillium daleae]|uniref:Uncharacterized protein n=1 Tax=Penicillium daleae TaxID=63821 RepID=A0AAD6C8G0_9EURO|nr:uncharacterized protein N7458_005440 [Penicillium daleae]KAJ5454484.1 hypothetical protein N7458_005440 [Penicillium daleae]
MGCMYRWGLMDLPRALSIFCLRDSPHSFSPIDCAMRNIIVDSASIYNNILQVAFNNDINDPGLIRYQGEATHGMVITPVGEPERRLLTGSPTGAMVASEALPGTQRHPELQ